MAQSQIMTCLFGRKEAHSMSGDSKNCSFNNPCPICGKPDWCNIVTYPNGNTISQCRRVHGSKGDVISASGRSWRFVKESESGFTYWQPLEEYEAYIETLKSSNKNYSKKSQRIIPASELTQERELKIEGVAEILPPEKLDLFYRTLLSILVLEKKHEDKLRAEWDGTPGLFEKITTQFPIKTLPPEDRLRFSSKEKLNNLSRKKIMEKLIEKCGEPKGVPGFYQRKDGVWTMYPLCGIIFPVFDTKGRIIRIRINTDYSVVKGELNGQEGRFMYGLIEDKAGWFFNPDGSKESQLVWQYGSDKNIISLDKKGYPKGKVNGKYKNFTSCQFQMGKDENGNVVTRVNRYTNGCESGSFCSVYTKEGDDPTWIYVTEGEKKAMVANQFLNVPVVSVPGVNSVGKLFDNEPGCDISMMDSLKNKGARGVILVFDADKSVNEAVLKCEQKAVEKFKERNIYIALGEWNPAWGKGLDDVLLSGVKPAIHPVR